MTESEPSPHLRNHSMDIHGISAWLSGEAVEKETSGIIYKVDLKKILEKHRLISWMDCD